MKKYYEAPSVEKISFRYRDQVVAASGENGTGTGGSNSGSNNGSGNATNDFVDRILEGFGISSCDVIGDIIGGIFG